MTDTVQRRHVDIGSHRLPSELVFSPARQWCLVLLFHRHAHGRSQMRNRHLAHVLQQHGLSTLRVGLIPSDEIEAARLAQDVTALAARMVEVVDWAREQPDLGGHCVVLLGACELGAAALIATAQRRSAVSSVVSIGGHLDLLQPPLAIQAPVLLLVGGLDTYSLPSNRAAYQMLQGRKRLELVPGARHRFEEPGTLDTLAHTVADWLEHCKPGPS